MPYDVLDPSLAAAAPTLTLGQPKMGFGYSLAAFRAELQMQLAGRTDIEDDRFNIWINDAYLDVCTSIDLPELKASYGLTFTTGQHLYLLPDQVETVRRVALVDPDSYIYGGHPIEPGDLDEYRRAAVHTGTPEFFIEESGMLVFWPKPDAALTVAVDFYIRPVELTDDDHCPFIAREWHEAILLMARFKAFSRVLEWENSALAENDYIRWIARRKDRRARQDEGRVISSSVPRNKSMLVRGRYRASPEPGF